MSGAESVGSVAFTVAFKPNVVFKIMQEQLTSLRMAKPESPTAKKGPDLVSNGRIAYSLEISVVLLWE